MARDTGDRRRETGVKRQETRDRNRKTGGRRHETVIQETGDRRP